MPDAILCVTCAVLRPKAQPREPRTPQVCDGCRDRMATDLTALPAAYAAVDAEPVRGITEIRSRVFESKPPVNISALSLLGPGWGRGGTPLSTLDFWVQDWAYMLDQQLPIATVPALALFLSNRLPWACDSHPAVDEFAADIRSLTGQLRAFENRDRGEPVGRCPKQVGDDRCNTQLYVDPYADHIQCSRCKQTWRRREGEWMHLRAQQLSAGVEAA